MMGGSGSKGKGYWPFSGSGGGDEPAKDGQEQSLARVRSIRNATPFVFTRRRSLFFAFSAKPPKAAPESAKKRKQEKGIEGSSAVFTGFVKLDDRFAQTQEVSYRSSD
ncbi:tumor suppressor 2, mitochondrial calcium regulator b isoform X2 [Cyprinus carpio]|uniref:Tumor suppressor 2, mitochondrial calcium regulator b isoform X2 n=1 Tax=Cyprinus carpio TaxID=7962 RepID=A0A9Q9Y2F7_CYPCA|nr:tumor suppressor 2, mitochondrial calcium regulator b isoform X2 [Cyprinus carpio]